MPRHWQNAHMRDHPISYHGLDHIVLRVSDITRTLDFYTRILGMHLERIIEDLPLYQVRCGRHLIDLQVLPAGTTLPAAGERGFDHVCLLVQGDFPAIVQHLQAEGVTITFGPVELYGATGFGTSVYILDPDGHTLELKADHAVYPLRTTAKDAFAALTRPAVSPRATGA